MDDVYVKHDPDFSVAGKYSIILHPLLSHLPTVLPLKGYTASSIVVLSIFIFTIALYTHSRGI